MTQDQSIPQVSTQFTARLTPNRSLEPRQFYCFMAALCAAMATAGVWFLSIGAWPVVLYCGLVAALTFCAFQFNYRDGRSYELVDLSASSLTLTRVPVTGRATCFRFNPYWVRFNLSESSDGRRQLSLTSHGRRLTFGAFLSDDEKRSFADAFSRELARARSAH